MANGNTGNNASDYKIAYGVAPGKNKEDKGYWTRIGVAFMHPNSIKLQLNYMPARSDIEIVLMDPRPRDDDQDQEGAR